MALSTSLSHSVASDSQVRGDCRHPVRPRRRFGRRTWVMSIRLTSSSSSWWPWRQPSWRQPSLPSLPWTSPPFCLLTYHAVCECQNKSRVLLTFEPIAGTRDALLFYRPDPVMLFTFTCRCRTARRRGPADPRWQSRRSRVRARGWPHASQGPAVPQNRSFSSSFRIF